MTKRSSPTLHNEDRQSKKNTPALLFDLDGRLLHSVYEHVMAWREALEEGVPRLIGMSGKLLLRAVFRETGWGQRAHVRPFFPTVSRPAYTLFRVWLLGAWMFSIVGETI